MNHQQSSRERHDDRPAAPRKEDLLNRLTEEPRHVVNLWQFIILAWSSCEYKHMLFRTGTSIYDVRKNFGIFDPLPLLSFTENSWSCSFRLLFGDPLPPPMRTSNMEAPNTFAIRRGFTISIILPRSHSSLLHFPIPASYSRRRSDIHENTRGKEAPNNTFCSDRRRPQLLHRCEAQRTSEASFAWLKGQLTSTCPKSMNWKLQKKWIFVWEFTARIIEIMKDEGFDYFAILQFFDWGAWAAAGKFAFQSVRGRLSTCAEHYTGTRALTTTASSGFVESSLRNSTAALSLSSLFPPSRLLPLPTLTNVPSWPPNEIISSPISRSSLFLCFLANVLSAHVLIGLRKQSKNRELSISYESFFCNG